MLGGRFPPGRNPSFRRTPGVSTPSACGTSAGTPRNAPKAARPAGLNSPVRGFATALLFNARPVASGLALIRCKGKANPA